MKQYRVSHFTFYDDRKEAERKYDDVCESLESERETVRLDSLVSENDIVCKYFHEKEHSINDQGVKKSLITYGGELEINE